MIEILEEMFLYYSEEGEHWRKNKGKNIISIDGTFDKEFEEENIFTIKDPFDKPHNPGRAKVVHIISILSAFKRGYIDMKEMRKKVRREERMAFMRKVFEKN